MYNNVSIDTLVQNLVHVHVTCGEMPQICDTREILDMYRHVIYTKLIIFSRNTDDTRFVHGRDSGGVGSEITRHPTSGD